MFNSVLSLLITTLLSLLPKDLVKKGLDSLLDIIENAVEKSDTKIDNILVLPLCKKIRESLNIPDNDLIIENPVTKEVITEIKKIDVPLNPVSKPLDNIPAKVKRTS